MKLEQNDHELRCSGQRDLASFGLSGLSLSYYMKVKVLVRGKVGSLGAKVWNLTIKVQKP